MYTNDRLVQFFRAELDIERVSGWSRLKRIPDTRVMGNLRFYDFLNATDRDSFLNCLTEMASGRYGFVLGLSGCDHTKHPIFERWRHALAQGIGNEFPSVPYLRSVVAQFKIDAAKARKSCVTQEEYEYALSVHDVKAPELRKGVKKALSALGLLSGVEHGGGCYVYPCSHMGSLFRVSIDYGGRNTQLRYKVDLPEFEAPEYPSCGFFFEGALGFGHGDWDLITEDNFEDSLQMLCEAIRYSVALPARIKEFCA
jgi:hypothetical protein